MALSDADATLIVGLAGSLVAYLGPRRARRKQAAREQTAAEIEQVIEAYKKLAEQNGTDASNDEGDDPA